MCARTKHIKNKRIHILWINVDEDKWNNLSNKIDKTKLQFERPSRNVGW